METESEPNNYFKDYYIFNLTGGKKIKIYLPDIMIVIAVTGGHNDLILHMRNNIRHIIRGTTLESMINITGFLKRANKHELVSPISIDYFDEDAVYLNEDLKDEKGNSIWLALGRTYKKELFALFHYKIY